MMNEDAERRIKKRTIGECAVLFIKEKVFSLPAIFMVVLTISLILATFTSMVHADKYGEFCILYGSCFMGWGGFGVYKRVKENGGPVVGKKKKSWL